MLKSANEICLLQRTVLHLLHHSRHIQRLVAISQLHVLAYRVSVAEELSCKHLCHHAVILTTQHAPAVAPKQFKVEHLEESGIHIQGMFLHQLVVVNVNQCLVPCHSASHLNLGIATLQVWRHLA